MSRLNRLRNRLLPSGLALLLLIAGAGCSREQADPRVTQIQQLQDKVEQQARQLAEKDDQLAAQAERIQELQGLSDEQALDKLVHVASIELARLSGGYDDDRDGRDDGVAVYLSLLDQDRDPMKAAGQARVRLFDLARPQGNQLVGEKTLDADTLRRQWYGRLMTSHYTIKVPWSDGIQPEHKAITIHAAFTDLLSGRTFETQQVVEITGAESQPAPASSAPAVNLVP